MAIRICATCRVESSDGLESICSACGSLLPAIQAPTVEPEDSVDPTPQLDEWGVIVEDAPPRPRDPDATPEVERTGTPLSALSADRARNIGFVRSLLQFVLAQTAAGSLNTGRALSSRELRVDEVAALDEHPSRFLLQLDRVPVRVTRYVSSQYLRSGRDDAQLWWSVGILLAEILTGRHPWGAYPTALGDPSEESLVRLIHESRPTLPSCPESAWPAASPADVDSWVRTVFLVRHLAHEDPLRRWGGQEVAAWLDDLLSPPIVAGKFGVWDEESLHLAVATVPAAVARGVTSATDVMLARVSGGLARLVAELRRRSVPLDSAEAAVIYCAPASRVLEAAVRAHANVSAAATGTRIHELLLRGSPVRVEDAAEFLIRLMNATPADAVVTRAEARYLARVELLRGTGVPIQPARVDQWLRGPDVVAPDLLERYNVIRSGFGFTRFAALREAMDRGEPSLIEALLVVAADPATIVTRVELERQEKERRKFRRQDSERRRTEALAEARRRTRDAEEQFEALLSATRRSDGL